MPGMTPAGDPGGVLEWQVEAAQVDQQAQVLDVGIAVLPVGICCFDSPAGASPSARRTVRYRSRHRLPWRADRSSCPQKTLEWLECQGLERTSVNS